ncbi:MAG: RNA methyltransferase [Planctomycetes bacterium]|nr:RNA methyltransferase [Planctomycetota bacterium]
MSARESEVIRSAQNPLVQRARAALAGREPGVIVLQGDRLVDDARTAGARFEAVLIAHDRAERAHELRATGLDVRLVDAGLLARASALATSPGIVALAAAPPTRDLATIDLGLDALVLVVAGIADPGNLGALARAAEAFGVAAFVVVAGGASPWNEKALRGSMGSLLRIPVVLVPDARTAAAVLARRSVRCARAVTRGGSDPRAFRAAGSLALWIGAETGDAPEETATFEALSIPMRAGPESLNVTVAASILLYELRRSRGQASGS